MVEPVEAPEGEQASDKDEARHEGEDGQAGADIRAEEKPVATVYADDDDVPESLMAEFWLFIKEEKKWWLIPIVAVTLLLFALFVFADSPAAPFIYTLF